MSYCVFWVHFPYLYPLAPILGITSTLNAYEDASKLRNVGAKSSDAGRLPKRHNTALWEMLDAMATPGPGCVEHHVASGHFRASFAVALTAVTVINLELNKVLKRNQFKQYGLHYKRNCGW